MTKWSAEMAKNAGGKKAEPMSAEDAKKYSEATTKFSDCTQKAMGAGGAGSAAAGSGSAGSATGSGSAVADTGSGSAGSAAGSASADPAAPWAADAAPVPATSKVTGKRDGNDEGSFDRAIYFKHVDDWGTAHYELHLSSCEKFSCAHYISLRGGIYAEDKFYADCPGAKTMDIKIDGEADPKAGPVTLDISINGPSSGGGLSGDPMKGSSLTAITDKEVKGKLAAKDGNNEAKGEFVAKNCGTMVFPLKKR
jgi:hypothetical protein